MRKIKRELLENSMSEPDSGCWLWLDVVATLSTAEVTVTTVTTRELLAALVRPKLIARRQYLGWTQETLAEVAGYAHVTVRYWENGTRTPTMQSLKDWQESLA